MSKTYDAKLHALKAYPDDKESCVDLFLDYLEISRSDFEYNENNTVEDYLFGKDK